MVHALFYAKAYLTCLNSGFVPISFWREAYNYCIFIGLKNELQEYINDIEK